VRLDLRLGWQPTKNLELSLVVQNALDNQHAEAGRTVGIGPTEIQRSFYGKLTWRF
jgi:iron complex outermembrane receptor protein